MKLVSNRHGTLHERLAGNSGGGDVVTDPRIYFLSNSHRFRQGEGQRAQDEETTFGSGSVANLTSLWVCSCRSEAAAAGIDEEVFLLEEEDDSSLGKGGGNSAVLGALVLLPIFCCSCCLEIKQRSTRRREEDEE